MGSVGETAHHGDFHPVSDLYYGLTWTYGDPRTVLQCDVDLGYCSYMADVGDMHTLAFAFEEGAGGGDPNPDNNSVTLETPVEAQSNLSITKRDTPDPVMAGQTLTYDLTVRNTGPSNADQAVITDELPMYTSFVSATSTPPGVTCSAAGKTVTCDLGTLGAPDQCETAFPEEILVTINVLVSDLAPSSVAPCDGDPLLNEASIASANCLPDLGTLSATASTDVLAGADVLIEPPVVESLAECVGPGAYIKVTQRFSNTGPEAYSIQHDNFGPEFSAGLPAAVVGVPIAAWFLRARAIARSTPVRSTGTARSRSVRAWCLSTRFACVAASSSRPRSASTVRFTTMNAIPEPTRPAAAPTSRSASWPTASRSSTRTGSSACRCTCPS